MAKVLIIDDSRFARLKLAKPIKEAGFEVVEAANGVEGLEKTKTEKPDVVLCDLLMPEMDGMGYLKHVKEMAVDVPVLIVTSDIQERTRKAAMDLGAFDVLNKPPKTPEVLEKIYSLTRG